MRGFFCAEMGLSQNPPFPIFTMISANHSDKNIKFYQDGYLAQHVFGFQNRSFALSEK